MYIIDRELNYFKIARLRKTAHRVQFKKYLKNKK